MKKQFSEEQIMGNSVRKFLEFPENVIFKVMRLRHNPDFVVYKTLRLRVGFVASNLNKDKK